jgi:5'-deoxynucleotidase YfbR-like HD superfamily hydrolase
MTWIQTHSGKRFDLMAPTPDMVELHDIATALSNLCRFTGHVREFYSVAQHSVFVSLIVSREQALFGLLHDATEAYVGDVARPLKALLPDYKQIEARVWRAVAAKFGISEKIPFEVKHADNIALMTERRDLLTPSTLRWADGLEAVPPSAKRIRPLCPTEAHELFIDRFNALTGLATV